jgi:hypothetical protein
VLHELYLIDRQGKVIASTDDGMLGSDRSGDACFIEGRAKTYIKPAYYSKVDKRDSFAIATPSRGDVLVAVLGLEKFDELTTLVGNLSESGEVLMAYRDESGDAVFFTHQRFEERNRTVAKGELDRPITQALLKKEGVFLSSIDYHGAEVLAVTRYIPELDVGIVVKTDKEEVDALISGTIFEMWIFTLGIFLSIAVIAVVVNSLMTKSLRKEIDVKTREVIAINASLEKAVAERTAELEKLNRELEENVTRRTQDLNKKIAEMEKFNSLTIGRELKMIELKKRIRELESEKRTLKKN